MLEQTLIIPLDDVVVGERRRPLNEDKVVALQASIAAVGLLQPIVITDRYGLVAGRHRLEAVRRLGRPTIAARIAPLEGLRLELAEIDENLMRFELTVLQQADHLLRRSEILEALGERAQVGWNGNQHEKVGGETASPPRTTAAIAADLGLGERSAQYRLQVARALSAEVKEAIAAAPIANRTRDLLDLARLDPEEQRRIVDVDGVKEGKTSVRYARRILGEQLARPRPDPARGRDWLRRQHGRGDVSGVAAAGSRRALSRGPSRREPVLQPQTADEGWGAPAPPGLAGEGERMRGRGTAPERVRAPS